MSEDQPVVPADGRNVHFYNGSTGDLLGGIFQNGAVTEANFIDMLNILLVASRPFSIKARRSGHSMRSGHTISRTNQPLVPGAYDVYATGGGKSYKG